MFASEPMRPRRRPSLTPMIDVVFLLLVFFMLASRFGADAVLPMPLAGGDGDYSGPPRLVDIGPASIRLNGVGISATDLAVQLSTMMHGASDPIIIRGAEGATLQRIITVTDALRAAGFTTLILVE